MLHRLRLLFFPPLQPPSEYDLNLLGVPPCGEYTPERWAVALGRRDYKRFQFLKIPLPAPIFGARLIVFPDSDAPLARPIELIILSRDMNPLTLLQTQTHELAHAALGHSTVTLHRGELAHMLQSNGEAIWEYMTCRAHSEAEEGALCDGNPKMVKQDVAAERLAQRILAREIRFAQRTRRARRFGDAWYEEVGRKLGLG